MLMTRQLSNPFPRFVLVVVVFWAAALFFGNGLVATPNPVSVGAHLVGAIAISTAIFLILELSQPYSGVVTVRDSRRDAPRSFSLAHTRPPYSVWTSVWPRARSRDGPCAIARRDSWQRATLETKKSRQRLQAPLAENRRPEAAERLLRLLLRA